MSETLEQLRAKIAREVGFIDVKPYSHNIVGLLLSQIAQEHGTAEANRAIRDFGLKRKGWSEVEEPCEKCNGTGSRLVAGEETQEECGECSGKGVV